MRQQKGDSWCCKDRKCTEVGVFLRLKKVKNKNHNTAHSRSVTQELRIVHLDENFEKEIYIITRTTLLLSAYSWSYVMWRA